MGLWADYNRDPMDDLQVPGVVANNKQPEDALAWAFGSNCLAGSPHGCCCQDTITATILCHLANQQHLSLFCPHQ